MNFLELIDQAQEIQSCPDLSVASNRIPANELIQDFKEILSTCFKEDAADG